MSLRMDPTERDGAPALRIFATYERVPRLLLPDLTGELGTWESILQAAREEPPAGPAPEVECICRQSPLEIVITVSMAAAASSAALLSLIAVIERIFDVRVRIADERLLQRVKRAQADEAVAKSVSERVQAIATTTATSRAAGLPLDDVELTLQERVD